MHAAIGCTLIYVHAINLQNREDTLEHSTQSAVRGSLLILSDAQGPSLDLECTAYLGHDLFLPLVLIDLRMRD